MRSKYPTPCDSCGKKYHELVNVHGKNLCLFCNKKAVEIMPNVNVKKMKCWTCGREGYIPSNIVLALCPSCQIEMKEVRV